MAQQNNSAFTTIGNIRIRGVAARSHLVHAENYQGQELYEIGITNPQFEDVSKYPQDQQQEFALAIDSMKKRVKPATDQYSATLWVKLPKYSRPDQNGKRRENHVIYLNAEKKKQIPTQKEIASGTPITAIVNCFHIANNKNVEDYDGIAGRLRAIMLDKVTDKTWYDPQNSSLGISGFSMLSDEEAFGTPTDNGSDSNSNNGNMFDQNDQNNNLNSQQNNGNAFNQGNNQQNNGNMFGQNDQNNNGNMFGSNDNNQQNPFGGQSNNGNPFSNPQNPQGNSNGNPFGGQ